MLKIGDFSKLGSVTVKALRHYARLGLLKPAWIDRFSGYRYYTLQQLPRLNRILALKELGFSLEQIAGLVNEDVPVEQLRGMLRRKQNELEVRLRVEQNRLAMVAGRLAQLERARCMEENADVRVKQSAAVPVAYIGEVVPTVDHVQERIGVLKDELDDWLERTGVAVNGPWMALYPSPEYRERDVPLELAVQVGPAFVHHKASEATGRVRLRTLLPAVELACLVHSGPTETLGQTYAALFTWMEVNQRKPSGLARELFLYDLEGDCPPDPFKTCLLSEIASRVVEVQIPVEPIFNETERQSKDRENKMEPKIITRPAFNVMGLCYQGNNQNQEIPALWGEFNQREKEVLRVAVPGSFAYGVCMMAEGLPEGHFEYVAGFEVPDDVPVPQGMVKRHIPANKYAVFEHRGALEKLRETYNNIYQAWLPQSGLEMVPGLDMEVYTEEFKGFVPDSVFYIYVPVK